MTREKMDERRNKGCKERAGMDGKYNDGWKRKEEWMEVKKEGKEGRKGRNDERGGRTRGRNLME